MPQFTVYLPGGGSETVNASNPQSAVGNVGGGASLSPPSGGGGGGGGGSPAPAQSAPASSSSGGTQQFNTVNGLQTVASMAQQLQLHGWQGNPNDASAVQTAYASTSGGSVTPSGSGLPTFNNGGGPAPSGPGQVVPTTGQLSPADQAILNSFQQSSGFSLQQLAEQKREFDANLDWQKQMWQQQGLPQLVIQQRAQALAEAEFQAQTQLAQQNLSLQRGQLGEQYLKDAASMSGPADYFQLDDFERGARQRSDVPTFLQALRDNTTLGNGALAGTPTPLTADFLSSNLTGGAVSSIGGGAASTPADGNLHALDATTGAFPGEGVVNGNDPTVQQNRINAIQSGGAGGMSIFPGEGVVNGSDPAVQQGRINAIQGGAAGGVNSTGTNTSTALSTIGGILARGGGALAPQSLEQLNPDEMALLQSGANKLGYSMPAFLQQYQQSRIGQGAAQAA